MQARLCRPLSNDLTACARTVAQVLGYRVKPFDTWSTLGVTTFVLPVPQKYFMRYDRKLLAFRSAFTNQDAPSETQAAQR